MQSKEAMVLREKWGDKPCDHPNIEKEYYLGTNTGEYVCTTCGWEFSRQEAIEYRKQRDNK